MGRKVNQNELKKLRRRVLDVASCLLGKVVTTLDEAEAELERRARDAALRAKQPAEADDRRRSAPWPSVTPSGRSGGFLR